MPENQVVTIDGVEYALSGLSEEAKSELVSLRTVDVEIARLRTQLAIHQTARLAYAAALKEKLPVREEH